MPPETEGVAQDGVTFGSRACWARQSRSHSGSWLSTLMVGGMMFSCMAMRQAASSTPPAAPRRWPVMDLVELMSSPFLAWSPKDGLDGLDFADVPQRGGGAVRVDVVNVLRLHACVFQGHLHAACGAAAFRVRSGEVVGVCGDAVADEFPVNLGAAFLGMFQRFQNDDAGAFAHDEAVAVHIIRAGGALGFVIAGAEAFMLLNPETPVGRMVASAPPQTMTSASPNFMMRQASPMLWLEVAQAVTMDMFGPPNPYSMEMRPEAMLLIMYGIMKGDTRAGPLERSVACWLSSVPRPADAAAHHDAYAGFVLRFQIHSGVLESHSGGAMAKCVKRSTRRASLGVLKYGVGSKSLTSPAIFVE